jgi:tRNA_anti-like
VSQVQLKRKNNKYLLVFLNVILIIAFFIPWVSWDKINISGADMPLGNFFSISEKNFQFANPFPQFNFAILIFWLIPTLAGVAIILFFRDKKNNLILIAEGILALCAVTVFVLFTNVLADLGIKNSFETGIYLTILPAAGIIFLSSYRWVTRIGMILIGPLVIWIGFFSVSNYLEKEEFGDTGKVKADYSVSALDFIREFENDDSLANRKYMEKILTLSGKISAIEKPNDSTINVKFSDSTGSYAIFPFEGQSVSEVKKLKEGDSVSVKGSCSGVVYSEILGAYFISFKRSVLNK